ncbi:MAG: LexA family protein [Candidatus Methylacidiphilales bacterium]|nr:LexA family transcriptional regulator [Candidatus Methylacidiphilales bacterium]
MNARDNSAVQRLKQWRVLRGLTQEALAKQLDINRSYYSLVESGRKIPSRELVIRMEALMGVDAPTHYMRSVPLLSWAQAGQAVAFESIPEWAEAVPTDLKDDRSFAVRLVGDSMEPRLYEGDIAILTPSIPSTNGDIVVANLKEEGVLCKIMHVRHAGPEQHHIKLSSYNSAYPPMEYMREDFHWIFPVAQVVRYIRRKG